MFNLGFGEALLIAVIALVFIGPKQLPEVARVLARLINEFKKAVGDVSHSFKDVSHSFKKERAEVDDLVRQLTTQIVNAGQRSEIESHSRPYDQSRNDLIRGHQNASDLTQNQQDTSDLSRDQSQANNSSEKILSHGNKKDEKKN